MPHNLDPNRDKESEPEPRRKCCGNLFGCGEEEGTGVLREDIKDAAFSKISSRQNCGNRSLSCSLVHSWQPR